MKNIVLYILLFTPRPDCVEKAVKANLTNCRKERRATGMYFATYPMTPEFVDENICDEVPEKDRKPIPKEHYEISLERPNTFGQDDCYDKKVGVLKAEEEPEQDLFIVLSSYTFNASLSSATTVQVWPSTPTHKAKKGAHK